MADSRSRHLSTTWRVLLIYIISPHSNNSRKQGNNSNITEAEAGEEDEPEDSFLLWSESAEIKSVVMVTHQILTQFDGEIECGQSEYRDTQHQTSRYGD